MMHFSTSLPLEDALVAIDQLVIGHKPYDVSITYRLKYGCTMTWRTREYKVIIYSYDGQITLVHVIKHPAKGLNEHGFPNRGTMRVMGRDEVAGISNASRAEFESLFNVAKAVFL